MKITFEGAIGGFLSVLALVVVSYIAVVYKNDTATGAVITVLSASVGYFLRGKVAVPTP